MSQSILEQVDKNKTLQHFVMQDNIELLCQKVKEQFSKIDYNYEHIIIDNNSNDGTILALRKICENDKCIVKKIHKGTELMILNNQE